MRRVVVVLVGVCILVGWASAVRAQGRVRDCVNVDGMYGWFPGNRAALQAAVDKYLADAGTVTVEGKPLVVIAPHAGYRWSGPAAGYAFKPLVGQKYSRVILLGPSHHAGFPGGSIADVDFYRTPLGHVALDRGVCKKLLATGIVQSHPRAHGEEHSLQNELPFLQTVLKGSDWKLVPIVVGAYQETRAIEFLADVVKTIVTPDTLIVVSSDFTHFGDRFSYTPFDKDLKENIRKLDQGAIDRICAVDYVGFRDYTAKTTICGRHPIAVTLKMLEGRKDVRGKLVHYAASGDRTNDYRNSVSYASIVLSKVEETAAPLPVTTLVDEGGRSRPEEPPAERLTEAEQKLCLEMARAQLTKVIRERRTVDPKAYGWDLTKKLMSHGAVFVTLKNHDRLRGCIGDIAARQPLYLSVLRNTINAAVRDWRFRQDPVTDKELPDIDIEISYLTPQKKVESYTEIVVGRHGVLLEKGANRSVYLPQVATEQEWDRETMLRHLCVKAELPPDAYKEGCTFHVFEAQVFGEKEYRMWPPKRKAD
ncbi:MAG TPA: AmmeMemoRadiSam system protein B [Planctomycetota bacterium]|nr:AmmeMemoRadiSam system protein B [Planctomycetota bacterium]